MLSPKRPEPRACPPFRQCGYATLHMRCGRPRRALRRGPWRGSRLRTGRAIDSPFDMWTNGQCPRLLSVASEPFPPPFLAEARRSRRSSRLCLHCSLPSRCISDTTVHLRENGRRGEGKRRQDRQRAEDFKCRFTTRATLLLGARSVSLMLSVVRSPGIQKSKLRSTTTLPEARTCSQEKASCSVMPSSAKQL